MLDLAVCFQRDGAALPASVFRFPNATGHWVPQMLAVVPIVRALPKPRHLTPKFFELFFQARQELLGRFRVGQGFPATCNPLGFREFVSHGFSGRRILGEFAGQP